MKSMTGFGQGAAFCNKHNSTFKAEITTLNRKQLDLRISLPGDFSSLEPQMRKMVTAEIHRGTVNLKITTDAAAVGGNLKFNRTLIKSLLDDYRLLLQELAIAPSPLPLDKLLSLPDILVETANSADCSSCTTALLQAAAAAVADLLTMRKNEGELLKKELLEHLTQLEKLAERLQPLAAALPQRNREKMLKTLAEAQLPLPRDDERILRELIIFADRYDVSEELARMHSHFTQFRHFCDNHDSPVGRSLEFVIQELHREITTLGNKAAATEISPLTVEFKTVLEKLREQVMNIE